MKSFIRNFDKYGYKAQLCIEGETSYKSVIGGFLTIAMIVLYFIGCIYFGRDIFYRINPIVITSSKEYLEIPDIIIGKKDFSIYFGLETRRYQYYIDPTIYTTRVEMFVYKESKLVDIYPMEVGPCSKYYRDSSEISNSTIIPLDIFQCIKPDEYKLTGYWGYKEVSQAHIWFERCQNTTKNINNPCKPLETINQILKGGFLGFYVTNFIKNINDYENPVTLFLNDNFHILDILKPLTCMLQLRQMTFSTDNGFLLENLETTIKPYLLNSLFQNEDYDDIRIAHIHILNFA